MYPPTGLATFVCISLIKCPRETAGAVNLVQKRIDRFHVSLPRNSVFHHFSLNLSQQRGGVLVKSTRASPTKALLNPGVAHLAVRVFSLNRQHVVISILWTGVPASWIIRIEKTYIPGVFIVQGRGDESLRSDDGKYRLMTALVYVMYTYVSTTCNTILSLEGP